MKKRIIGITAGVLSAIVVVLAVCFGPVCSSVLRDFGRLMNEDYDTVVMSMYPIDNYKEEDYMYYRGMDAVKMIYDIPSIDVARVYLMAAKRSGNTIGRVYLGVDPEETATDDLVKLLDENPGIAFEIVLAYPQIGYWTDMKEERFERILEQYHDTVQAVEGRPLVTVYSFGSEEWLIANPRHYDGLYNTTESISEFLMCNTDRNHPYLINSTNMDSKLSNYHNLYEKYIRWEAPADASHMEIVFFGDSIIGNYTDDMSIPEVVSMMNGATVYNLGYGGISAAECEGSAFSFPAVVDAFLAKDVSRLPADSQAYAGLSEYLQSSDEAKPKAFIINYGMNDYYLGVPVEGGEMRDVRTYAGALRSGIEALREAYPGAQIVILTPHFTSSYDFGKEPSCETGGTLEEYADAVIAVADEYNLIILDNFRELPVTPENWLEYQPDGTHLNERGRFIVGDRIAFSIIPPAKED